MRCVLLAFLAAGQDANQAYLNSMATRAKALAATIKSTVKDQKKDFRAEQVREDKEGANLEREVGSRASEGCLH